MSNLELQQSPKPVLAYSYPALVWISGYTKFTIINHLQVLNTNSALGTMQEMLWWTRWHTQHNQERKVISWHSGMGWQIQRFKEKFIFNRYIGVSIMNVWSSLEDYVIWYGQENGIICPALDLSKVRNKGGHHFSLTHLHFIDELFWCRRRHKNEACCITQETFFHSFVKDRQEWVVIAIYV